MIKTSKPKQIIITKLFESGGSNSHLKTLLKYFREKNVILILEDEKQKIYLNNIVSSSLYKVKILKRLHAYAHLQYLWLTNIKELTFIIQSIICILFLSIKHGFATVTISSVEPEKHLYFLWMPFIKVVYILHSTPAKKHTPFTSFTCNRRLSKKKQIVTVSNSNKNLICENWDIQPIKKTFVKVIHNCILEADQCSLSIPLKSADSKQIVTIGQLTEYKNPFLWLQVAKQVTYLRDNVYFIWLGGGNLFDYIKNLSKENDRITFTGVVSNPDYFLRTTDLYYQPSLFETHGIAVLEAMYRKIPCVVANIGGLPESVKDKVNGILIDPQNIQENVDAIIELLDNDELRLKYGLNSFKRYQDLFTYNSFKSNMDAVYN